MTVSPLPTASRPSSFSFTLKTALCMPILFPLVAAAADATTPKSMTDNKTSWGLGIAAISFQQPYKGIDRNNLVIPLVYIENDWLQVFGLGADLKLPGLEIDPKQKIDFRIATRYDVNGYKDDDASILRGMKERKGSFLAGGKAIWHNEFADIGAEWLADISGNSNGQVASLWLEKTWRFGEHMMIAPRLSTSWMSGKYVDYYYGVNSGEVGLDRSAYEAESGFNTTLSTRATYMFDRKQSLFLDLSFTKFSEEIEDSPIVDRSSGNRIGLGYLYRF